MKVLLTKPFFEQDLNYIKKRLNAGIDLITPNQFNENEIAGLSVDADVLFGGLITEKILASNQKLQLIQIPWTGVDNLNYELLRKYKIPVANSHSNSGVVAEHAVALLFDAAKKLSYHDKQLRLGNWNRPKNDGSNKISPFSFKIQNSKVAFIGFGSIAQKIARFMVGFDCQFRVFNRMGRGENIKNLTYTTIDKLNQEISSFDIIFVAIALTDQTRGLLGGEFFRSLKQDSILINISRGEIMQEEELFRALNLNPAFIAGIDTWYKYPTADNPEVFPSGKFAFHELDNIIMSPHRAGMIKGELPHLDDAIENLNRLAANKPLINLISLENKY